MKFPVRLLMTLSSGLLLLTPMAARAITYNLTTDWSDAANANGVWSYRQGTVLLPHVSAWQGLSGDFSSAQPAWARFETGTSNLPCFFRSSASVAIAHDWVNGDVICHTTDGFNGIGSGKANIVWSSPVKGTIDIAGGVWMGRDIGRSNHWDLVINGTPVTGGQIASGDPYSRATPFLFSAGTGGAAAVTGVPVNIGDKVELDLTQTTGPTGPGDYVGITWTITTVTITAVRDTPERPRLWVGAATPNPTRGFTSIPFRIDQGGPVELGVYDVAGRRVSELVHGEVPAGDHMARWDGRDALGRRVNSGVYFYRLAQNGRVATGRLTIVR